MSASVNLSPAPVTFDRILKRREVQARIGLGHSMLYELMGQGKFPKPVRLGARAVGWRESEVQAWIESLPRAS